MRHKAHTISKLDAQKTKLQTLVRQIEAANISGPDAILFINSIIKEITLVIDRLDLESDE